MHETSVFCDFFVFACGAVCGLVYGYAIGRK